MEKIIPWLAGLGALIVGALAIWFNGRSSGKESEQAKRADERQEAEVVRKKVDQAVTEAKRKADAESIVDVRDRVKSGSVRKPKT